MANPMNADDRNRGMGRRISRRDFLNGVALAITASSIPPLWLLEAQGITAP